MNGSSTAELEALVRRWQQGDIAAANQLIGQTCERLRELTRRLYHRGVEHIHRWEDTADILQRALMRLWRSLQQHPPNNLADYFRRAAVAIRRELIDLCRHYFGPWGMASHHDTGKIFTTDTGKIMTPVEAAAAPENETPSGLVELTEFHQQTELLPEPERQVFDLIYYHGLTGEQTAKILGISKRTVLRRWESARTLLARYWQEPPHPGTHDRNSAG